MLTAVAGFTHLGMNEEQAATIDHLIAQPYGAVLVAGPVGAGKTSTLYNCLERINSPLRNVMTIEQQFPGDGFSSEKTLVLVSHFADPSCIMLLRIPHLTTWANGVAHHGTCSR